MRIRPSAPFRSRMWSTYPPDLKARFTCVNAVILAEYLKPPLASSVPTVLTRTGIAGCTGGPACPQPANSAEASNRAKVKLRRCDLLCTFSLLSQGFLEVSFGRPEGQQCLSVLTGGAFQ